MNRNRKYAAVALPLLSLAGLSFWVNDAFHRDLVAAQVRTSSSLIAQTPCGPIEYATAGMGPAVLIVHGAGGGFDQGLDFGLDFAKQGFRVVSMSRFGYLRTPLPANPSAEAQADAHRCLLDSLGIEQAAVVGASAGAPSALLFALRHPSRCSAVALVVPALFVPRKDGAPSLTPPVGTQLLFDTALNSDFLFWVGPVLSRDTLLRTVFATPPEVLRSAETEELVRVQTMIDHILPVGARRAGLLNDAAVTRTLVRYPLESVRVPTLALSVKDDLFGTYDAARYTAEHVPGARFIGFETGGHLFVGRHQAIIAEIVSFIRDVQPSHSE